MNNIKEQIKYWFMASRGYSIPMSLLNWLIAFAAIINKSDNANILYGVLALFAILFAHLGTNLFDDCIDFILKVPKQDCKMKYLKEDYVSLKQVFGVCALMFLLALIIGIFFLVKFHMPILYLTLVTGLIIILYPKLNNFALGEIAVGLCFGLLLFAGVGFVMTGKFDTNILLISLPVGILTASVVFIHSIMDFESDKKNNKNTLCVILGSKSKALFLLILFYIVALIATLLLIYSGILPKISIISLIFIIPVFKLYFSMKNHIKNPTKDDFMPNFSLGRNISLLYNVILTITLLI